MTMKLSKSQLQIIQWMLAYPGVQITYQPGKSRPTWTMWWASEEARQHMLKCTAILGMSPSEKAEPRWQPQESPSMTLRTKTVDVLIRLGLLRRTKYRPARKGLSEMGYYSLTARGKAAAKGLELKRGMEIKVGNNVGGKHEGGIITAIQPSTKKDSQDYTDILITYSSNLVPELFGKTVVITVHNDALEKLSLRRLELEVTKFRTRLECKQ